MMQKRVIRKMLRTGVKNADIKKKPYKPKKRKTKKHMMPLQEIT